MVAEPASITDAVLASIVEVHRRIRPETPPEGLIAFTPNLVRAGIILAFMIGCAVVMVRASQYFYPGYPPRFR